jgi:hypothetical protein
MCTGLWTGNVKDNIMELNRAEGLEVRDQDGRVTDNQAQGYLRSVCHNKAGRF